MRKLLLAMAATLGATLGLAGGAKAQPKLPPAAGTLTVHLNGYFQFQFADFGSTYNTVTVPGTGTFKLNPITTMGEVRLYPGFDGMSRNGVQYGVQIELRTNYSDAGVGANKTNGTGSTAGTSSLYVRRAYAYVGTVDAGYIRLGQTDSAFSLLQDGVIEAFGDGSQWPGDGTTVSLLPTAATPGNFIYADTGNLYATGKVVFISPAFDGFSAMAGFEPNSNGLKEGNGSCTIAGSTCAALSSSPVAGDIGKRRKNTIDGMVQYSWKGNGFVVKTSAGFLYGSPIGYDGPAVAYTKGALYEGYDSLQVYQAGGQVTYAGVTLGANIKGGQVEDSYAFKPKGARDALAYLISANYVIGPYVIGASYWNSQSAGAYYPGIPAQFTGGPKVARTLSEYGVAVGGNYVVSPALSFFVQYLYGHKHQPGVAFGGTTSITTGTGSTAVTTKYADGSVGNAQIQAIGAGLTIKW
jgi:hypothetical protein